MVLETGINLLGFNFFSGSKRALTLDDFHWISALPKENFPSAQFVAVVVNPSPALLNALVTSSLFELIQFHGDESPEFCATCPLPWIKAAPVLSPEQLATLAEYPTPWLLLDAPAPPGQYGGTGQRANWQLARDFIQAHPQKRVLLAGGITPGNALSAWQSVSPFALDLASGVETSPRQKSPALILELLQKLGLLASRP
jgi:phosphoribosylanthranilate isomerase